MDPAEKSKSQKVYKMNEEFEFNARDINDFVTEYWLSKPENHEKYRHPKDNFHSHKP